MGIGDPAEPYGTDSARETADQARELARSVSDFVFDTLPRVEETEAIRSRPIDPSTPKLDGALNHIKEADKIAKQLAEQFDAFADELEAAADELDAFHD